jgi:ABC-type microcin C transport system duplicated ATPase subunit YejF
MIFQDPMTSLNPVLTIGEQIIETLLRHTSLSRKKAKEKSFRLLEQMEIPSPKKKIDPTAQLMWVLIYFFLWGRDFHLF